VGLRSETIHSVHDDVFHELSALLHTPPTGFTRDRSFKTFDDFGNLQLSFFSSADGRLAVDMNIDVHRDSTTFSSCEQSFRGPHILQHPRDLVASRAGSRLSADHTRRGVGQQRRRRFGRGLLCRSRSWLADSLDGCDVSAASSISGSRLVVSLARPTHWWLHPRSTRNKHRLKEVNSWQNSQERPCPVAARS